MRLETSVALFPKHLQFPEILIGIICNFFLHEILTTLILSAKNQAPMIIFIRISSYCFYVIFSSIHEILIILNYPLLFNAYNFCQVICKYRLEHHNLLPNDIVFPSFLLVFLIPYLRPAITFPLPPSICTFILSFLPIHLITMFDCSLPHYHDQNQCSFSCIVTASLKYWNIDSLITYR